MSCFENATLLRGLHIKDIYFEKELYDNQYTHKMIFYRFYPTLYVFQVAVKCLFFCCPISSSLLFMILHIVEPDLVLNMQ